MSDFLKGMETIGQLFPSPMPYEQNPSRYSAWQGVANSFRQAGGNIRSALNELADARRDSSLLILPSCSPAMSE